MRDSRICSIEYINGLLDHGLLLGLGGNDHNQYLLRDGTNSPTATINWGGQDLSNAGTIAATTFTDGTATLTGGNLTVDVITGPAGVGNELVSNGSFTGNADGWTVGGDWQYNSNRMEWNDAGTSTLSQALCILEGKTYTVAFDVDDMSDAEGSTLVIKLGGTTVTTVISAGAVSETATAGANGLIEFVATFSEEDLDFYYIDNISVKRNVKNLEIDTSLDVYGGIVATGCSLTLGNDTAKDTYIEFLGSANDAKIRFDESIGAFVLDDNTDINMGSGALTTTDSVTAGHFNMTDQATGFLIDGLRFMTNEGTDNVLLGIGTPTDEGSRNVFIGDDACTNNNTTGGFGRDNVYIGQGAGGTSADNRSWFTVAIGALALANLDNSSPLGNMAIGGAAMLDCESGENNIAMGLNALRAVVLGDNNVAVGMESLRFANAASSNNTAVGREAGEGTVGNAKSGSVYLGYQAGQSSNASNVLYIANSSTATPLIYGEFANTLLRVTATTLDVVGNLVVSGTSRFNDKIFFTQADGAEYIDSLADGTLDLGAGTSVDIHTDTIVTGYVNVSDIYKIDTTAFLSNVGTRNTLVGEDAGINDPGQDSVFVGYHSGYNNDHVAGTTGYSNVYIGPYAGEGNTGGSNNTGYNNIGIGLITLQANTSGYSNVGVGVNTLKVNTSGYQNTAVGTDALQSMTLGFGNVGFGYFAGDSITTGEYNVAIGFEAIGDGTATGDKNVAIGQSCMKSLTSGGDNVGAGYLALFSLTSGFYNIGICREAGFSITDALGNVCIGFQAGENITTGDYNVCLGYRAGDGQITTENGRLYIANTATATPLIYGEFANTLLKVTATNFDVVGTTRLGDGGTTNYSEFEVDGTLEFNGAATIWNDIQFQISDAKVTPASLLPSWEAFTANTSEYAFGIDKEVDTSANEIPHSWKQGTAGHAHIHITTKAINNTEVTYAKFTVTFAYADIGEVWVETPLTAEITIANPTAALTSLYLDLGDITLTNYLIEAQMRCRVKRIPATTGTEYVGDIFITQVGIHFEEDTVGSRTERDK